MMRTQELEDFVAQRRVFGTGALDVRGLLAGRELEDLVEDGVDSTEPVGRGG